MNFVAVPNTSDSLLYLTKRQFEVFAPAGSLFEQAQHFCVHPESMGYLLLKECAVMLLTFEHLSAICRVKPLNPLEEKLVRLAAIRLAEIENVFDGSRESLTVTKSAAS
jgi:hypothetical protein